MLCVGLSVVQIIGNITNHKEYLDEKIDRNKYFGKFNFAFLTGLEF